MKCRDCGNERDFMVSGVEVRKVDQANPEEIVTFFVVKNAVCMNEGCPSFPSTNVELDEPHPLIKKFWPSLVG